MTNPNDTDAELTALYEKYATHIRPLITQTDDHTWRAQYPGVHWHVTADSEQAAADAISTEALRRLDAGEPDAEPPHDLLIRHLAHPIPGVYALDRVVPALAHSRRTRGNPEGVRGSRAPPRRRQVVHDGRLPRRAPREQAILTFHLFRAGVVPAPAVIGHRVRSLS